MARYREYFQNQTRFLPISLTQQIRPRTIEYTMNYLVDHDVDLSVFDSRYRNDATGTPTVDPAILLKIILFAYSHGIPSSRQIAQSCEENVVFMALACDTRPHFTTIADFIFSASEQISAIFRDILAVCYTEGLIGRTMFAVDGGKIASTVERPPTAYTRPVHESTSALRISPLNESSGVVVLSGWSPWVLLSRYLPTSGQPWIWTDSPYGGDGMRGSSGCYSAWYTTSANSPAIGCIQRSRRPPRRQLQRLMRSSSISKMRRF